MQNLEQKFDSQPYDREQWGKGYQSLPQEYEYWIDEIEGEIPQNLEGTLFRNGPGLLEVHGIPLQHPFDGDGMISAVSFKDGRAHFRNRFVKTKAYLAEQEAGKMLYRGVFGTQKPGGWLNNAFDFELKNIANTNIIYWGDRLLALWEAAEPYRLDPQTLETIGIDYLDGVLEPGDSFSAHPWIDPNCKMDGGEPCLVNFSIKVGLSSTITIYEFNPQGKLLRRHAHTVPGFSFIHDFAITPNYCIFFQNPVSFNPIPFVLGFRGAGECVKYQPDRPTKVIIIPRNNTVDKEVKILETNSGFVFHHVNAREISENEICIDSVAYEYLPQVKPDTDYKKSDFEASAPGQLWQFTANLKNGSARSQLINARACEFPVINPNQVGRDYRYLFVGAAHNSTGNAPLQAILKFDRHSLTEEQFWSFAPYGYVSEPIFVPKPDGNSEDDGWILALVYDGSRHCSKVAILDGKNLNNGPIAQLYLKHHIPYGLHGSWTDKYFISLEEGQ
ncbi:MAG: carotenoid oxygenase family protein [Prochloraceae cyanobacterium]|nr:carotenoid oxygenase family protein [Prochloraceae cyanobacterium]